MKYLKKYQTKSEYDADYYSGKLPFPHVALVEGHVVYAEQFESETDERTPFYIEAIEDLTVKFSVNAIEYSLDNSLWESLPVNTETPTVSAGNKIYFRAKGLTSSSSTGIGTFTISGKCNLGGNIMSMQNGADFLNSRAILSTYRFSKLFYAQAKIINAKRLILPAQWLHSYCYQYMFYGCSSLVEAPELPATSLADYCYCYMFYNCTSLVKAPALPAQTMASNCYLYMFYGCSGLVEAPELPATRLHTYCYSYMFSKCTSLVKAPALHAASLSGADYCYQYMFNGCSSLVEAPKLPSLILSGYCYYHMFDGCTRLVKAPELPATSLANYCYSYMFNGCSSLVKAPELPALSPPQNSYSYMFQGCSNLQYIKAMMLTAPSSTISNNWVNGVGATGTFVKNFAATWENTFGNSLIPSGWTVELADA